jgi:hypothetical protein
VPKFCYNSRREPERDKPDALRLDEVTTVSRLEKLPVISWAVVHPRIAAWIVLSLGMVILLAIEAREVGLLPTQWIALFVACVLVAGACVWIISWEGDDEAEDALADDKPVADKK